MLKPPVHRHPDNPLLSYCTRSHALSCAHAGVLQLEYSANVDVKPLLFHYRIEAVDSNSQSNEHVDSDRSNLGDSVPVDTTHKCQRHFANFNG